MKHFLWLLLFSFQLSFSQKLTKSDKITLANLERHIQYLSKDELEGRRTGTKGEKLAYEYIQHEFEQNGLIPKGEKGSYLQQFEINDGKEVTPVSHLIINGQDFKLHEEYFPFIFSPNTALEATTSIALHEQSSPWFFDLKELLEANKNNPHYDLREAIKNKALEVTKKGANALLVFNSASEKDDLRFEGKEKASPIAIPVLYISKVAKDKYLLDETATLDMQLKVHIDDKKRYGHNVIGYINNNAPATIVIGAHYDHLGYGEDHNSLYTGVSPAVHNGADDNASGTAALIELGNLLKNGKLKNHNYLLVAFSGEELGLFGSKYFTEHPTIELAKVNFMINMDMIGRLKDSTRGLSIGGVGTSPEWSLLLPKKDKYFKLSFDSSGTGPSDHTSFYRKNIPVLFFFTGTHSDYHKPTDDADKINYAGQLQVVNFIQALLASSNKKGKLPFSKTRETQMNAKSTFKVSLGIMPDYTYSGPGVRADGVTEGRAAQKAGILAGDIIVQIGDYTFDDMQSYMQTLNKFNKGDSTTVKVKRGTTEFTVPIVF